MVRPLATAAALALALLAVACGGEQGAGSPVEAVSAYNRAVADGDGERACARLDEQAQRELQRSTQGSIRGSCRQVIELVAAFYDDATKERLRQAKVEAQADGDRATARFRSPVAVGGPDEEKTYELRRVDGDWKIASLGIAPDQLEPVP